MGVSGDFRGLEDLRARMAQLATARGRMGLNRVLAEEAAKLIDDEFRKGQDPCGKPWKPLKRKRGRDEKGTRGQILLDTGALLNSLGPRATREGFTVSTAVKYAAIHQYGGIIKLGARYNAHKNRGGQFLSQRAAGARKTAVKVSFSKAHEITIPQRQYMPEGDVGPIWKKGLEAAADDHLRAVMGVK